ncbi:MAG: UDP-2,3-diacylglucosamine diphosphatase [Burkholderiales bacterium PBB4]|nr:MAG: UDP-2,3-diacylglucosamine diphosphatase [Burkholderiales bacterium PBB4]
MPDVHGMELLAPSSWNTVDFISDLHLQASEPMTFAALQGYLGRTTADAVVILGDLFEVWVGDDAATLPGSFEFSCVETLRSAAARLAVFIMHGNRDFLMGPALMEAAGASLVPDPTVLCFAEQRWLLTHGDALCLADTAYLAFREQVRSSAWQTEFLEKPLADRLAIARHMREESERRKRSNQPYADVDFEAADQLLRSTGADTMVHGHTHKPDHHTLGAQRSRWVLSDWDLGARPPRAQVLRIDKARPQPYRINPLTL